MQPHIQATPSVLLYTTHPVSLFFLNRILLYPYLLAKNSSFYFFIYALLYIWYVCVAAMALFFFFFQKKEKKNMAQWRAFFYYFNRTFVLFFWIQRAFFSPLYASGARNARVLTNLLISLNNPGQYRKSTSFLIPVDKANMTKASHVWSTYFSCLLQT